ncbi:MAG: UPF0182 family protein [Spirochaetaceae bacterium]
MFTVLGIAVLAIGAIPLLRTIKNANNLDQKTLTKRLIRGGLYFLGVVVLLIVINVFFSVYSEYLWFAGLDYQDRYLTEVFVKVALFAVGAVVSFVVLYGNFRAAARKAPAGGRSLLALPGSVVLAVIMGTGAFAQWDRVLLFLNQAESGTVDPAFGRPVNFYLFSLPLYQQIVSWLIFLLVVTAAGVVLSASLRYARATESPSPTAAAVLYSGALRRQLLGLAGVFLLVLGVNSILNVFELVHSESGVVTGAGWNDMNVRVPAYYVSAALYALAGLALLACGFSRRVEQKVLMLEAPDTGEGSSGGAPVPTKKTLIAPVGVIVVLVVANGIVPSAFQSLVVEPNEVTAEAPYIRHNIDYTRRAYGLSEEFASKREFPVGSKITPEVVADSEELLENVRLWDPEALHDNLRQRQEIRPYYRFQDVDIDRYMVDGEYRQMMLSVRELDTSRLPERSQSWVSRRLKYTHGHGLVMLPVHEFLDQGRPRLFIQNIPPEVEPEGVQVTRPGIYYGERTNEHVYTNTTEEEFDYPAGGENVYSTYEGTGGVVMDSLFKRFMYAWKFDGHRLLFSDYFRDRSRILFDRNVTERVAKLAPFLAFDEDPYPVLTEDGRIKYVIDAYTVSDEYPYSEHYGGSRSRLTGANYIRNSVKAVVDAYDGSVDFYAMDIDDVMIESYRRAFPDLFKPVDEMPDSLRRHMRYPVDFFTAQAEMMRTYNMTNVAAFYQREDLWEFATERYRGGFQSVRPYYIMVEYPDSDEMEFVLMLPFTPKDKNVIHAWVAGRSDEPHYGELTVFTTPKGVEVLGPRQIDARIDQNAEMSELLSLWSQQGSGVIRGNLLSIPLFHDDRLFMLFAEPIFLEAESAELPELRRVALADQDRVVWAETFDVALNALLGEQAVAEAPAEFAPEAAPALADLQVRELAEEAVDTFQAYRDHVSDGNFAEAGEALDELSALLEDLPTTEAEAGAEMESAPASGTSEEVIEAEAEAEEADAEEAEAEEDE